MGVRANIELETFRIINFHYHVKQQKLLQLHVIFKDVNFCKISADDKIFIRAKM